MKESFQRELGWVELEVIGVSFEGFTSSVCTCCLFVLWRMLVCLGGEEEEEDRKKKKKSLIWYPL